MLNSRSKLVFKSFVAMLVVVCGCARQSQPPPRAVTKSQQFVYEQRVGSYAARSVRLVDLKSANGRVKKNELPLANWLSAQIVPP
jgi:hypothetical protein